MEIDFMILWKKTSSERKDLLQSVFETLQLVFPNTDSNNLIFEASSSETHSLPYKISNSSNDVVYLKIECDYSEARSSRILSMVRDKLCSGRHRSDFSIICTYDDASLSFCCRLMKPFGVFERRLREIMYMTIVKAFGCEWVSKTFSTELIAKIKKKTGGKLTENAFELLDYSEITSYLFDDRRLGVDLDQIVDEELSDDNLKTLTKEEIVQIISRTRCKSLWDVLFSDNKELKLLAQKVESFRNYRNDTMHHHTMDVDTFEMVQRELNSANSQLKTAVFVMEDKIYTQEDITAVFSALNGMLIQLSSYTQEALLPIIEDVGRAVVEAMNDLEEIIPKIEMPNLDYLADCLAELPNLQDE